MSKFNHLIFHQIFDKWWLKVNITGKFMFRNLFGQFMVRKSPIDLINPIRNTDKISPSFFTPKSFSRFTRNMYYIKNMRWNAGWTILVCSAIRLHNDNNAKNSIEMSWFKQCLHIENGINENMTCYFHSCWSQFFTPKKQFPFKTLESVFIQTLEQVFNDEEYVLHSLLLFGND